MNHSDRKDTWERLALWAGTEREGEAFPDVLVVEDAVVDSVSIHDGVGYVTITEDMTGGDLLPVAHAITLVVGSDTVITDQFGNPIDVSNLREGMVVDAAFSSRMTRSIPPQAVAYNIVVVRENLSSLIEVGRVLQVEGDNSFGYVLTGNQDDIYSQIRYVIGNTTKLRDRNGNRIEINAIKPGQIVRVERASFQTASLPPQTSALSIQILSC